MSGRPSSALADAPSVGGGSMPGSADAEHDRLLAGIGQVAELLMAEELTAAIWENVLAVIGGAAEASRVRAFRILPRDRGHLCTQPSAEWCAPGIAPASQRPELPRSLEHAFARWGTILTRGEVVAGLARDFPPHEQVHFAEQDILALALVPVRTDAGLWGFLGFDECRREQAWRPHVISAFRTVARMLGATLERSESQRRQLTLEANHTALLDNLNEGVFKTDDRGRFTYLNDAWRDLTGYTCTQALGRFCGHVVGPEDRVACRSALVALLHGAMSSHRCEARLRCSDGSSRWVQISTRRIDNVGNGHCGLVGTLVDISTTKKVAEQLVAAKQEAEAASRAKSEFLSTMSHELRTPLNAVIGLSESLLEAGADGDAARTRRYLQLIHGAGQQLFRQINDILDLARVEAGKIKLAPVILNVGALCTAARDAVRTEAAAKDLTVEVHEPAEPVIIRADERLLAQALHNLVVNAVKFTPASGRIGLTVTKRPEGGAVIAVSDTGIGIAPEKMRFLFKPFSQVDSSLSRRYGGTGLGLVLVDKFVRLHGGAVSVESRSAAGSTFTIILPDAPPAPSA